MANIVMGRARPVALYKNGIGLNCQVGGGFQQSDAYYFQRVHDSIGSVQVEYLNHGNITGGTLYLAGRIHPDSPLVPIMDWTMTTDGPAPDPFIEGGVQLFPEMVAFIVGASASAAAFVTVWVTG